jgi:RNA 3'-terminal phosphate cyclase (ATP)
MGWGEECLEIVELKDSAGPGNVLIVELESEHVTEVFCGFGQKGVLAEKVAGELVDEVRRYLAAGVPVGRHLADQLLLPMALAGAGAFRTLPLSRHASTQPEILRHFLDVRIEAAEAAPGVWQVEVR